MENPRFSSSDLPEGRRGGEWVIIQFVILAFVVFAPPIFHVQFFSFVRYAGIFFVLLGFALGLPGILHLGRSGTPFPRPIDKGQLVTSGPYHLVRHPVYFSVFLVMFGWGMWSQNLVRILLSIALFVFLDLKSKYEEDFLEKTYPEYKAYKNAVKRRLIPWIY